MPPAFSDRDLRKPRNRHRRAQQAWVSLALAGTFDEFEDAWEYFLAECNGVFDLIESAARGHQSTKSWFGVKKKERQRDPLLCYLWNARNSNEHSVRDTAEWSEGAIKIGAFGPGNSRSFSINGSLEEGLTVRSNDGLPVAIDIQAPGVVLLSVRDIHGKEHLPPTEHLGSPLVDPTPLGIASAGLRYCEALLAESSSLMV